MSVSKIPSGAAKDAPADDAHAPRPLTASENMILILKLLAVVGLLGGALWAVDLWTMAG